MLSCGDIFHILCLYSYENKEDEKCPVCRKTLSTFLARSTTINKNHGRDKILNSGSSYSSNSTSRKADSIENSNEENCFEESESKDEENIETNKKKIREDNYSESESPASSSQQEQSAFEESEDTIRKARIHQYKDESSHEKDNLPSDND